jgi:murein DD-endopeptidase MepM/ murein hydrolase activator NlpD
LFSGFIAAVVVIAWSGTPQARAKAARVEPPAGYVALASAPPQRTKLTLPFEGMWGVIQGMDSKGTHTGYAAYAFDFVPAEAAGSEAEFRKRRRLDQHACYGRPILAPADGRVVWARDGGRELPPFREARRHEAGNFIIIEHAPDELTEFRHLKKGSLAVKVGDVVRRGQVIAACGNSGNALTPHLHFAFLGSVDPIATRPMRLSDYEVLVAPGVWQKGDGELKKGQILRPSAAPP